MRTVLYIDTVGGDLIQDVKRLGMCRYFSSYGWRVHKVQERGSRPRSIPRLIRVHAPAGFIVEGSAGHHDLPPSLFGDIPVVYLDTVSPFYGRDVAYIVHDGLATTRLAFRELLSSRPDAFAVVDFGWDCPWARVRVEEFVRLARATQKACPVFRCRAESRSAWRNRLGRWVARLPRRCAVFAVNDYTAMEVLRACEEAGRRVPSELSVLGVDNVAGGCDASVPSLSSIQIDFERAGYRAAEMLDLMVHGRAAPGACQSTFGPLAVVRRESTRGGGQTAPELLQAMDLIRREACNGLMAASVVARFEGSRRFVEKRFRETFGHSILDEIQNVRMEKVRFLLANTDMPISAIAAFCGYRTDIALRKAFRSAAGLSLRGWRKQNRG